MKMLTKVYYSFPIQLLLQHFKKHQILLLFWLVLFGFISSSFGKRFGIPYLFLDPEYLGEVNFYSFFIVGFATGGFIMIWQITSYILHSWRFPFLAAVSEPFIKFCLNNSILPLVFICSNIIAISRFQHVSEGKDDLAKFVFIEGYLIGLFAIVLITLVYFFSTNRNVLSWVKKQPKKKSTTRAVRLDFGLFETDNQDDTKQVKVDYYFNNPFRIKHTRNVEHYDKALLQLVYKQHYFNSLFIELTTVAMLLSLSLLMDYKIFRIPAAASVMLFFAVITILVGAFSYWLRGWRTTVFILLFVVLNFFSKYDLLNYKNKVYGLNYETEKIIYNSEAMNKMCCPENIEADKKLTEQSLDNWANHFSTKEKPYLFFINVSGGGSRSALWTFSVLQHLDSMFNGKLMNQTFLISGASGGMLGASFYRELYLRSKTDKKIKLNDKKWNDDIADDFLNAVTTSIAVNDLFVPWISFKYAGNTYKKDRGYAFERQLNDNTENVLNKKLIDYSSPEAKADIPWMILNGTIINDGRTLMMSAQPISYMCKPSFNNRIYDSKIDAIDFRSMFAAQHADSTLFTTALRLNCTFPYILPNASLPTKPKIEVMDAGIRDNYGFETSIRFVSVFKDWIVENTAGIVLIQITDFNRSNISLENNESTAFEQLTNPITNVFYNFPEFQYYHQNNLIHSLSQSFPKNMYVYRLEYTPQEGENRASLSFHLTTEEKKSIQRALMNKQNKTAFESLTRLMGK